MLFINRNYKKKKIFAKFERKNFEAFCGFFHSLLLPAAPSSSAPPQATSFGCRRKLQLPPKQTSTPCTRVSNRLHRVMTCAGNAFSGAAGAQAGAGAGDGAGAGAAIATAVARFLVFGLG